MAKAPEAISPLMFNGADQTLVKDGIAIGGILVYGLSESGSFSTTLPTGKEIGEYTVYYKVQGDANHNDTAVQSVKVTIYPDKITSDVHTVEQSTHIRKIEAGLTVSRLWENINEKAYVTVFNADGTVAQSDALAATGMKAKMFIEGVEVDSVTVIVTGDVNGDGKVSITDMAATNNHILEKTMLTGVYLIAGDTNKDGKVSITDYAQITYHVLEKNQVEAN